MMDMIEANWLAFALALLIGLLVAWWLFGRASTTPPRSHSPDVLDEGAAPAARNQALIDAPAAVPVPTVGAAMGGIAEAIAIGATDLVEEAAAAAPPAPAAGADDLTRIKGLGPKLASLLGTLGISSFAQISAWDEGDIDRIDAQLGTFAGRIRRDNWVDQARFLAAGDVAGFEAQFGKL